MIADVNFIVFSLVAGSITSLVFWSLAGLLVRGSLRDQPAMHRALVYLTIAAFVVMDIFTFAALGRMARPLLSSLFAFSTGLQTVAAIAAVIFVRRTRRR